MLGPEKARALDRPVLVSLEALVPRDHFYRHLERRLDLSFVRELTRDRYSTTGRPGVDPVVFFKLQLIMFFEGIRSERRLIQTASLNLAHRWYLGYALDEPLPDHSTLSRIRARLGLPVFRRFFERVVELCQVAGLVWGQELHFDATRVRANADVDSLVPRLGEVVDGHVRALFGRTEDGEQGEDGDGGGADGDGGGSEGDDTPPSSGSSGAHGGDGGGPRRWDLLDEGRPDPSRPASQGYRRISDQVVSRTDPDAASMSYGGRVTLGYQDHYVVDGGRHRIILHALAMPAHVMENTPMLDLLWRVRFRWKLRPTRAVGDTTYGTTENIRTLEDAGIRAYVPLPNFEARSPLYGASRFAYVPHEDAYRCPEGHPLTRRFAKHEEEVVVYAADAATCNACPVKAACTASPRGRQVRRSYYAAYLDRVRGYHQTAAYRKAMRKRAVWVEPLFGEAKQWHGLRTFRLRGLPKVNTEALLVAAGQNLKRYLSATGWGRRHAPAGALALSRPAPAPHHLPALCPRRRLGRDVDPPARQSGQCSHQQRAVSHQAAWFFAGVDDGRCLRSGPLAE